MEEFQNKIRVKEASVVWKTVYTETEKVNIERRKDRWALESE